MASNWVTGTALVLIGMHCVDGRAQPAVARDGVAPADRSAIERLLLEYNEALSSCAATRYAGLFTPDGTFTSDDFRGATHRRLYGKSATLVGRDKLTELVNTEEFCLNPEERARRSAGSTTGSTGSIASLRLQQTPNGVRGVLPLANNGRYEDLYVKTTGGWKFKSRTVVMPATALPK